MATPGRFHALFSKVQDCSLAG